MKRIKANKAYEVEPAFDQEQVNNQFAKAISANMASSNQDKAPAKEAHIDQINR